jgi:hypothetical protein
LTDASSADTEEMFTIQPSKLASAWRWTIIQRAAAWVRK